MCVSFVVLGISFFHIRNALERVRDFLTESKTAHLRLFFTFFQSRSPGYAPKKR
jgi:hypothetical protein